MSILGPMVVIADQPASDLIEVLGRAGAFRLSRQPGPMRPPRSPRSIPGRWPSRRAPVVLQTLRLVTDIAQQLAIAPSGPFIPIIARVTDDNEMPPLVRCRWKSVSRPMCWCRGFARRCACARCMRR